MLNLETYIKTIPNFPKPGISFKDITPLLLDSNAFRKSCEEMLKNIPLNTFDYVCGIEARGFIFASGIAILNNKGLLPLRKAGKLPGDVLRKNYSLEYGDASIEVVRGSGKVLLVDDVLATGGTLSASIDLLHEAGYTVTDVSVLINLTYLNNRIFNDQRIHSVINFSE